MPLDAAHERLKKAWAEIVQQKANTDVALADRDWERAGLAARDLRWACSELEEAISEIQSSGA